MYHLHRTKPVSTLFRASMKDALSSGLRMPSGYASTDEATLVATELGWEYTLRLIENFENRRFGKAPDRLARYPDPYPQFQSSSSWLFY